MVTKIFDKQLKTTLANFLGGDTIYGGTVVDNFNTIQKRARTPPTGQRQAYPMLIAVGIYCT